jgi:hypothetical protein
MDLDSLRAAARDADAALKTANAAVDAAVVAQREADRVASTTRQRLLDFLTSNVPIAVSVTPAPVVDPAVPVVEG